VDKTTNLFQVIPLVRATKTIGSDLELEMDDVIMNYTTTPLMDGSKAWRGPREKDISFMSSLIMATTDIGQNVVDVNTGVGMSYFICHHVLVFIF
jgi:hypothetical protein